VLPHRRVHAAKSDALRLLHLALLDARDIGLDAMRHAQNDHLDGTLLADAVDAVSRLVLVGRVVAGVEEDHPIGRTEVEARAGALDRRKENARFGPARRRTSRCRDESFDDGGASRRRTRAAVVAFALDP